MKTALERTRTKVNRYEAKMHAWEMMVAYEWMKYREKNAAWRRGKGIGQTQTNKEPNEVGEHVVQDRTSIEEECNIVDTLEDVVEKVEDVVNKLEKVTDTVEDVNEQVEDVSEQVEQAKEFAVSGPDGRSVFANPFKDPQ